MSETMDIYQAQQKIHPQWQPIVAQCLGVMDQQYLHQLASDNDWLPGLNSIFAAFSLPRNQVRYLLIGESPYPRAASANGYAFWDNAVDSLWSERGFSKEVNRATSLRNWLKMLLVAKGLLHSDTSQHAIAQLDKTNLVKTAEDFFCGMMSKQILLLNASLVYSEGKVPYHARYWKFFMQQLLTILAKEGADIQLILLGKIAEAIPQNKLAVALATEHPYNISFIHNQQAINFFRPLDLLAYEPF